MLRSTNKKVMAFRAFGLTAMLSATAASPVAYGQATGTVLVSLNGKFGAYPHSALLLGPKGVLYGTAYQGGRDNLGTVFVAEPPEGHASQWTVKALFNFNGKLGANPTGTLLADSAGALYGTTVNGGRNNEGVVFKLTPPAEGSSRWKEAVLYNFGDQSGDGANPYGGLIFDGNGILYGTTETLGAAPDAAGTVFSLTPPSGGKTAWTESVLYSFGSKSDDGANPYATLLLGKKGILFGTTMNGGSANNGTVFELKPPLAGKNLWRESVLYSFLGGADGVNPYAGVITDKQGTLFGTTANGGKYGGVVFSLTPPKKGSKQWQEAVLANLYQNGYGGLIRGGNGVLFGATEYNGDNTAGTVYKLVPPEKGSSNWQESDVYDFGAGDGANPICNLIADNTGALYINGLYGGNNGYGEIWKITGTGFVN